MMGWFVLSVCPIAFSFVVLLLVMIGHAQIKSGGSRLKRSFQALARKYHGYVQSRGMFGAPVVHFRHGSSHVAIRSVRAGGIEMMQYTFIWPDRDLRLEMSSNERQVRVAGPLLPEFLPQTGPAQDPSMFVRGAPEQSVARLLSSGVQWQMNCLYHLLQKSDVHLTINEGIFSLRKLGSYRLFTDVDELTRVALELHDQALLTRSVGIEFLSTDTVLPIAVAGAKCQICWESLGADHVICRTCKTPHHRDCWTYAGCCSVFACRDTRYLIPVAGADLTRNDSELPPFRKPR